MPGLSNQRGALGVTGLGSLCHADFPQGNRTFTVGLHLPLKLLLLRRDPEMLYQTRTKREIGVPCLTPAPVAGSCLLPPALLGGGGEGETTHFCPHGGGVFADIAALRQPKLWPRFADGQVPFAGRQASAQERERFDNVHFLSLHV